ncbi:glycoside hydrolase family 3 C-terminal domain-containing protein [Chryseosolibacter indicus]|uniref:Glycoside hydrolase family 3 C-terminal domain-containing protein n=1 Tax=Chryseosolibacter indicus TaxID=2782351 RepID=A0ABS5VWG9_9BACT|nr:glycoside hydrolase family 3 C-terminal domain-containing protein [Chryseosolibacter indicus]MBT1705224.1 glycoside hydrolase family 3 C-terminal domain-containing protein [Chryseosolibacter indicus]
MNRSILLVTLIVIHIQLAFSQQKAASSERVETRVKELLSKLTLEEKISLLGYNSPAIPRLGIRQYNWWNEALHGVARAGEATVFPQAIGMAATFNDSLVHSVADIISTEARAKYNIALRSGKTLQYQGLTFWSPNINIFRDPRWGRGQETYGEDPFLTSKMGVAYVKGLQGNDSNYLKASACAKHYAVHSGPEEGRHSFDAVIDEKDMRETYLYAFEKLVGANVESVMCAYNRVNGEPCCTSNTLLRKILLGEWKFSGHVVTDCGALDDIFNMHKVMPSGVEVAAAAVKTGVSIDCSTVLQKDVMEALNRKLITEGDVDWALAPALRTQFKLGFFDDANATPFHSLDEDDVRAPGHVKAAREVARQSMVLLKNNDNLLPLAKDKYHRILVAGTNAASAEVLFGNYHGMSSELVTFAEGISREAGPGTVVQYDQGSNFEDTVRFGGLWVAENSDVSIVAIGFTPVLEGEEGDAFLAAHGGDRKDLNIPRAHIAYLKAMRKRHNKPIVAVVTGGSSFDVSSIEPYADAIILTWYPGEQGGNALADILFGKVSPAGRLPVTFYRSFGDLPPYASYNISGRTYRYYDGEVQYPFGFGLSYTTFSYSPGASLRKTYAQRDTVKISVVVNNTGNVDSDEVVQAYIDYPDQSRMPLRELKAFKRVHVPAGSSRTVVLSIPVAELRKWNLKKREWEVIRGPYEVVVGAHSRDEKMRLNFDVK